MLRDQRTFFNVGKISQAADLPLIFDQVALRDKRNEKSIDFDRDSVSPNLIERHLPNRRQNVDMILGRTETQNFSIIQ